MHVLAMALAVPTIAAVVVLVAMLWGAGILQRRRYDRLVGSRFPVGPRGIIRGAEPIALAADGAPMGVVLLHGFGDTPQTVASLARALRDCGYDVDAPLLPGHGRTLAEFAKSKGSEWLVEARRAHASMRARHSRVALVGLSLGGALAASIAADDATLTALVLLAPYLLVFLAFVVYPVGYGFWLARHPESYVALYHDPIFARAAVNTLIFLLIGINFKMLVALFLSGFFIQERSWIKWLSVLFILPWAVPSIPTILSVRFMFNPEWGMVNQLIFRFTGEDGPNWLNDPAVALTMAIGVHIWKSLPFWTLILMTGRLAISADLFEAADVDGATWWQKFRFITWPSMRTLYLTSTILSMIWTLGDFNSVYLLTGGGPADLTHVLATLGIRYLRLDQLSLAMASIVCALPFVLPLVYFMMKRLSR